MGGINASRRELTLEGKEDCKGAMALYRGLSRQALKRNNERRCIALKRNDNIPISGSSKEVVQRSDGTR